MKTVISTSEFIALSRRILFLQKILRWTISGRVILADGIKKIPLMNYNRKIWRSHYSEMLVLFAVMPCGGLGR